MAKILLVEDNEMNRDMLSRRLKKKGHEVSIAVDGKQGVDMAVAEKPEIILLDMSLPVVGGWEAARALKAACCLPSRWRSRGRERAAAMRRASKAAAGSPLRTLSMRKACTG